MFASSASGPVRSSITKQQKTSSTAGHAVYQGSFTSGTYDEFLHLWDLGALVGK